MNIKLIIYQLLRKKHAKKMTNNMGKVQIEDDKIVCLVDKNRVNKIKNKYGHEISLRGTTYYSEALKNKYNLNKPIYYIFKHIEFNKELYLTAGPNAIVEFEECIFNKAIDVTWVAEEIIFKNNIYYNNQTYFLYEKPFFSVNAKRMQINDVFMNMSKDNKSDNIVFGTNIIVDELNIQNSFIYSTDYKGVIKIICNNLKIVSSIIDCCNIKIKSDIIEMEDSNIIASDSAIIDSEKCEQINITCTKEIVDNGVLNNQKVQNINDLSQTKNNTTVLLRHIHHDSEQTYNHSEPKILKLK